MRTRPPPWLAERKAASGLGDDARTQRSRICERLRVLRDLQSILHRSSWRSQPRRALVVTIRYLRLDTSFLLVSDSRSSNQVEASGYEAHTTVSPRSKSISTHQSRPRNWLTCPTRLFRSEPYNPDYGTGFAKAHLHTRLGLLRGEAENPKRLGQIVHDYSEPRKAAPSRRLQKSRRTDGSPIAGDRFAFYRCEETLGRLHHPPAPSIHWALCLPIHNPNRLWW